MYVIAIDLKLFTKESGNMQACAFIKRAFGFSYSEILKPSDICYRFKWHCFTFIFINEKVQTQCYQKILFKKNIF